MNVDLTTKYLGLTLSSPLVASASPCTGQPDVLRHLQSSGAGAAVLPSLFEEQVALTSKQPAQADLLSSFSSLDQYNSGADNYTRLIDLARHSVSMPIIASLNGTTPNVCAQQARRIAEAGADALELNLYSVPIDANLSGMIVESRYLDVIAAVRQQIRIPLAVKIGPYISSLPYFARQAVEAGANGLVLFNRFLEPEIHLETRTIEPHLELSHSVEARLTLRWLGILRDQLVDCSFAASSGIQTGIDALKAMAVGANVAMMTSVLLKQGVEQLQRIHTEMIEWLSLHGYGSAQQLVGSMSREKCGMPAAFERANYAGTIASYLDLGTCSTSD